MSELRVAWSGAVNCQHYSFPLKEICILQSPASNRPHLGPQPHSPNNDRYLPPWTGRVLEGGRLFSNEPSRGRTSANAAMGSYAEKLRLTTTTTTTLRAPASFKAFRIRSCLPPRNLRERGHATIGANSCSWVYFKRDFRGRHVLRPPKKT